MASVSAVAPVLRYRDLDAAVDWLCTAFGMERLHAVADAAGALEYAELRRGLAFVLLSKVADSDLDALMLQPNEVGGAATQTSYIVVEDADAHASRARKAGAEIVLDVRDDAFGGRSYTCRDPEGHVWNFGTNLPRSFILATHTSSPELGRETAPSRRPRFSVGLLSTLAVVALVLAGWTYQRAVQVTGATERVQAAVLDSAAEIGVLQTRLEQEQKLRGATEQALQEASARLTAERDAKAAIERDARNLAGEIGLARIDKEAAERAAAEAHAIAEKESRARVTAEQSAETLRAQLDREMAVRQAAEAARMQSAREDGALEALRAELAQQVEAKNAAESRIGQLQTERDEIRQARDALALSAAGDRDALAREQAAMRQVTEQLAQEQSARKAAQAALEELSSRPEQTASVEGHAVSEQGQAAPAAKEHATSRRKMDAGVDLLALYNFLAKARGTPQAERARSRLRNLISTTRDSAQLSRFIAATGEGPFVELAKRRVQALRGRHAAKPEQEDDAKPPAVVLEQRELLERHKTYATSP